MLWLGRWWGADTVCCMFLNFWSFFFSWSLITYHLTLFGLFCEMKVWYRIRMFLRWNRLRVEGGNGERVPLPIDCFVSAPRSRRRRNPTLREYLCKSCRPVFQLSMEGKRWLPLTRLSPAMLPRCVFGTLLALFDKQGPLYAASPMKISWSWCRSIQMGIVAGQRPLL